MSIVAHGRRYEPSDREDLSPPDDGMRVDTMTVDPA
jgi:hypothetical protein